MFRKNKRHFELPLTSNVDELPPKLRKRLDTSWSGVFYREFFSRPQRSSLHDIICRLPLTTKHPCECIGRAEV